MKRREFSTRLAGTGLGLALAGSAAAQDAPVEGQQYKRVSPPAEVSLPAGKKIEVVEFFWYECPHCFALDPLLAAWIPHLAADVVFHRVPVGYTARHQLTQKLYYALQEMGAGETLHQKIFNAIHRQGQHLLSEPEMEAFVSANGLSGAKFRDAFRSFGVATLCNRAKLLTDAYQIDGVPTLGIQGRYTTSAALTGSHERALDVADVLIDKVRKGG